MIRFINRSPHETLPSYLKIKKATLKFLEIRGGGGRAGAGKHLGQLF